MVIGANPTDGAPGVRLAHEEARLRQGAKLIVVDPRRIDLVDSPHVKADYHLQLRPGTNVALVTALAHVIVTEGLLDEASSPSAARTRRFAQWREFVARPRTRPRRWKQSPACRRRRLRGAARLYATGGNAAIYYGLGVTEHARARPR